MLAQGYITSAAGGLIQISSVSRTLRSQLCATAANGVVPKTLQYDSPVAAFYHTTRSSLNRLTRIDCSFARMILRFDYFYQIHRVPVPRVCSPQADVGVQELRTINLELELVFQCRDDGRD